MATILNRYKTEERDFHVLGFFRVFLNDKEISEGFDFDTSDIQLCWLYRANNVEFYFNVRINKPKLINKRI